MDDLKKTKQQLINELAALRQKLAKPEQSDADRKQAEEALRESEQRLYTTLRSIGDAVIATDAKGLVTLMNPIAENLTGWGGVKATGRPLEEVFNIINEQTGEQAENPVARVLREGTVVGLANHTVLIAKDGTKRPIADSGAPMKDEEGNIIGTVMVFRDITKRRQAEEELAKARALLDSSLASTPDGVFMIDKGGSFSYANPAFLEAIGLELEELIGKTIQEIVPKIVPAESARIIQERAQKRLQTGEPIVGAEIEILGRDGSRIPISYSAAGIKDTKGNVIGEVVFLRDITERRNAEEELRKAQEKVTQAAQEIMEIANPIVPVFEEVLALPIVGTLDSQRAQQIMENLLQTIVDTQSKVVIIDITGVPVVDTLVATHLLKTADAVRLLGAQAIITGISPTIAQTLVTLGIDLTGMTTRARLINGVSLALKILNKRVVNSNQE